MTKIIGTRFRRAGKIYYFSPGDLDINLGDNVIVETARGIEFGRVVIAPREVPDEEVVQPLKSVIRRATPEDYAVEERNREKEKNAFNICLEKIKKHGLAMKLIECEYTFDNNKVLFYFTADGRIDFRQLVKDLAAVFRTRIELRQIGVRDEAKTLGGIGICGRPLCCSTYLTDFAPVSIRMAKEQNMSLNPSKLSGNCGRLMCCLSNEEDAYEELNAHLPGIGDHVVTKNGQHGEVSNVNVLKQIVRVVLTNADGDKEAQDFKADELTFKPRKKKDHAFEEETKEIKELEMLEKRDGKSKFND